MPSYRNFSTGFFQAANGCETIYLDYRCAPDYQYPTQLNEALDLWDNLTKRQGYAPDQIILGGDSAGANLALALLLKLWDLNKTMPRAAFCISAWTDMTCNTKSFRDNYGRDVMFGNKRKTLTEERLQALMQGKISYHRLLDFIRESFAREQRFKYYGNNSRIIAHFSEEFL